MKIGLAIGALLLLGAVSSAQEATLDYQGLPCVG